MRFLVGAIVSAAAIALIVAYKDFKELKMMVGLTPYSLSLDCHNWYQPAQSFSDYLKVVLKRVSLRSQFEFLSLDPQGGSPVAYNANDRTALLKNGFIYMNSDYTVYQNYDDVLINKGGRKHPYSLIFNKTVGQNSLLRITKIKSHYQVVFFENQTQLMCDVSKEKRSCSGTTWTMALDANPRARNALDVFCQNKTQNIKKFEDLRSQIRIQCESDFSFDQGFELPCEIFKGR